MRRSALAVGLALAVLGAAACERSGRSGSSRAAQSELGDPSAIYTVRGEVVQVPDAEHPGSRFEVRHEAIDNFVDAEGKVVGMSAMVMPFPLAQGVTLNGIEPGDKVEVTFAVWWKPRRHYEATKVVELPSDTELHFRPARPPGAESPSAPSAPSDPSAPSAAPAPGGEPAGE